MDYTPSLHTVRKYGIMGILYGHFIHKFLPDWNHKIFRPILFPAAKIGGLLLTESHIDTKLTQYTGGWNFFVSDFNKLLNLNCSQGEFFVWSGNECQMCFAKMIKTFYRFFKVCCLIKLCIQHVSSFCEGKSKKMALKRLNSHLGFFV